ncbi:unnamed protein product, partial [Effrenium voratum]
KSSMTSFADSITRELDKVVQLRVNATIQAQMGEQLPAASGTPVSRPHAAVLSTAMASATREELFHRCAGDFKQVKNSASLPGDQGLWRGRQWFGVLGNLDETYDFLTAFGLLSDETAKSTKASTKVNPRQSALNKLLQFGSAARATKTSGSYGDSSGNGFLGVVGNMHPATYVPMERSETGAHHAATKERFFDTQRPSGAAP